MLKLLLKGSVLVVILYITTVFISRQDNRHRIEDSNVLRIMASRRTGQLDMLFIGSSYVYSGIMAREFDSVGIKAFNLGIATSGAFYTQLLARDFLKTATTKSLCISMAYTTFSDIASDAWHLYPIHRYLNPPLSNEKVLLTYGGFKEYFQMYRNSFRKGMSNLINKSNGIDSVQYKEIERNRGYEFSYDTVTPEILNSETKIFEAYKKSVFSEFKAQVFNNTIDTCIKRGISVTVIEPPTYHLKNYFDRTYITKFNKFKAGLKNRVRVIESDSSSYNQNCFRNTDHLNANGARKYTAFLIEQLKRDL